MVISKNDTNSKFEFITIDSHADWRKWFNSLDNKTYIIRHDPEVWHRVGPPHACILYRRINTKMNSWGNASKLVRHDSKKQLWATIKLPDHFCLGCGKHIRLNKIRCWPCVIRDALAKRPFFDDYIIEDAVLTSQEFEKCYRLLKFLKSGHKLRIMHLNCPTPKRCDHIKWYLRNHRQRLAPFRTKTINDTIQIVKTER